ncbi:hypothetical protein [Lunatibacter salilacus]|uniref:hypothetical protein n=1 Tax=Lunatibacter salilacus TaxID=2483804 RepID=UPI00131EA3B3|nr:hypothetical protein [Lunatibacter salilacus]
MNKNYLPACAAILEKKLELPEGASCTSREELASFICPAIRNLLDRDMGRLLQLCYQIDVGEEKLKSILQESPVTSMAMDLSLALVDRQLLKFQLREKYSSE